MNEFDPVADMLIEQLVDGELCAADRRQLLLALDHESDGWRRLGIAFLEAQALRESLHAPSSVSSTAAMSVVPIVKPSDRIRLKAIPQWAIVAVCGLLMFSAGRISSFRWSAPERVTAPTQTYASIGSESERPRSVGRIRTGNVAKNNGMMMATHQTLRLELGNDSGPTQSLDVPVVNHPGINPEDLLTGPPVIPERLQRELMRTGRRVHEQRQLIEITLDDGRHGFVPISEVRIEDAGWDVYQ